MAFPFDNEDEDIEGTENEDILSDNDDEDLEIDSDYEIDFDTMKLTGKMVEGLDCCIQWAKLSLLTHKGEYDQYDFSHGSELHTLIGYSYPTEFVETESYRMITECLENNKSITGVEDFTCEYTGDSLKISFTLQTIYGSGGIELDV